ncbi:hypothetical protein N9980_00510 [bacterium]|nr:hypothetical protein [bacterium]
MATTELEGAIFTLDVDTTSAVAATKTIDAQTQKIEKSFKGVDTQVSKTAKSVKEGLGVMAAKVDTAAVAAKKLATEFARSEKELATFEAAMRKGGRTISSNGVVLNKLGNASDVATKKLASLRTAHDKLTASSGHTNKNIGKVGRSAGQAGIQFQQLIGQVQGGQGFMLALSQQSADLGFVLGAPLLGAIAGITASVVGMLVPSLMSAESSTDKFEKAIESVKATLTLSADGVANYTENMKKLSLLSKELAATQLRITIAKQQEAFKLGSKALQEYTQDVTGFVRGWSSFEDRVGDLTGKKAGAEGFEEARLAIISLKTEVAAFSLKPTEMAADDLSDAILRLEKSGAASTEKGRALLDMVLKQVQAFKEGKSTIKQLNDALKDNKKITEDGVKSVRSIVTATKRHAEVIGKTAREIAILEARRAGAKALAIEEINTAFDAIEAFDRLNSSIKKQADTIGMSARSAAIYQAKLSGLGDKEIELINKSYDTIEAYKEKTNSLSLHAATLAMNSKETEVYTAKLKGATSEELKAIKASHDKIDANKAMLKFDPIYNLKKQKDEEIRILAIAEEKGLQMHTSYAQLKRNIDKSYEDKESAAKQAMFAQESKFNELALSSVDALGVATTNTLSGLLSGTYSATEAMQQFANTILNSALGALVDVGVQYLKNAVISQTADKTILASQLATKATNATAHTAAVAATVAELTSLAAAGAFAATAAIPIVGPGLAPAAAGAAGAATAGLGSAAITAAPIAGARYSGGNVAGGSTYEVGEKNKPEMLMIPGNNGRVFSNAETNKMISGGGGSTQVVINNNAPGVQVIDRGTQNDGVTEQRVIEIINAQSAQVGSNMNNNINRNHNTTNRIGGNRRN